MSVGWETMWRWLALGATKPDWVYPEGADFVVLADPDGNLFCVIGGPVGTAHGSPPD